MKKFLSRLVLLGLSLSIFMSTAFAQEETAQASDPMATSLPLIIFAIGLLLIVVLAVSMNSNGSNEEKSE